jgi:DNA-binding beta-propeller fold protein YncE
MCRQFTCRLTLGVLLTLIANIAPRVVASAPVGWWKLDDGSGAIARDSSGNNRHGILLGGPQWVSGQVGGALRFDGANDYVSLAIGPLISTLTSGTFTAWANFEQGGSWVRIFDFGTGPTVNMFLTPAIGTDGAMRFAITTGGNGAESQLTAPSILAPGWHHVAVVIDGTARAMQLYLDGATVAGANTNTLPRDLGATAQNWLGRSQYAADGYYKGMLDDFRIYDQVLSGQEIGRVMLGLLASNPFPADGEEGVFPDAVLSWMPGESALRHDVYLGTDATDVDMASRTDPLGVLLSQGQDANTFDPIGLLNMRQTYYWRIDEVETDSQTIHKGAVWTFSTCNFDPSKPAVYTNDADFDLGTLVGVEHDSVHGQLQLSSQHVTLPFIWVPNSNEGTVSKVDTRTGRELARYRTGPSTRNGNPSRTTVDLYGNCWVGNRYTGTVVKIGLLENSQYMDRNHNGLIETSTDLNGDGQITGDELLPWASDECVIYEVVLIPGQEGTYIPGQYQGEYAADDWMPGPRGIAVDAANNVWAGCYGTEAYYYIDGRTGQILHTVDVSSVNHTPYGAVMDENGILWSSGQDKNHVLQLNPANFSFKTVAMSHLVYGLGIDGRGHLFASGWDNQKLSCVDIVTGTLLWTKPGGNSSRGVACTDDGDVWVADSGSGTVSRYDNNGNLKTRIDVGNTPTGVSVDATGKVWVVCLDNGYIFRIDPSTNMVDLTKVIEGTQHYGYSDMTGIVSRTYTTHIGSWTVLHLAGTSPAALGPIAWIAAEPPGAFLDVYVRSTIDLNQWSPWEFVCNGTAPRRTPPGRFYEIEAAFEGSSQGVTPILYELTVQPAK